MQALDPEKLREVFKRKRYGGTGDYDPDFDLFDVAADEIERLRADFNDCNSERARWRKEAERLRAAMNTIACWYIDCPSDAKEMAKFASAALGVLPVGRKTE
jgi:hypothetical protein